MPKNSSGVAPSSTVPEKSVTEGSHTYTYYEVGPGEKLPKEALSTKNGLILIPKDGNKLYISSTNTAHSILADALGLGGFDRINRPRLHSGKLEFQTEYVGNETMRGRNSAERETR